MQGFLPVFQGHFEASTHLNYAAKHGSPFHQLPNAKLAPNTVNGSASLMSLEHVQENRFALL